MIAYFRELISEKLEREENFVWSSVACLTADLDASELVPLLRQPYDDEWIDPFAIEWDEIENPANFSTLTPFEDFRERHPPITDVASETRWWGGYARTAPEPPPKPAVADAKPGRNDQCPCGSGKKYKKCCGKAE